MGEEVSATVEEQKQEIKAETPAETKTETKTDALIEAIPAETKKETKPKKKIVKSTISVKNTAERGSAGASPRSGSGERKDSSEVKEEIKTETKTEKKKDVKKENIEELKRKKFAHLKLFNRWPSDVVVSDLGLRPYVNLMPVVVPWSAGRSIAKQFWKSKKSIIERLMLKLMVAGHKGKKHYRTSNVNTGKLATQYSTIKKAFELIEQRAKKNPVEVFVRALEVGSPREGIATIEYGGVRYPKAADMAPQRRVDLVLRWMTQAAFVQSAKGKKHVWAALADEIMATANNDTTKSNCLTKKQDLERQSGASR